MPTPVRTVLISGASVAGPALALCLGRLGFEPTVVEKAPALRPGGYAVDFRGTSVTALERLGLLEAVRAAATNMGDMHYVNRAGRPVARLPAAAFSGEVEIMRGDLAEILHAASAPVAQYRFGDSIAAIADRGERVDVTFDSGRQQAFDLVIGADGLHSNVRGRVFAAEAACVNELGMCASIFTVPNRLGLDYAGKLYSRPGTVVGVYSARQNREARAMFYFRATPAEIACRDVGQQQAMLRRHFAGQGWCVAELLADMESAPDFYFDSIAQVRLPRWSRGRVGLVGDAAGCASPLSGMGTGMAVVGAYILASELAAAPADPGAALARYEQRMRPFVAASQRLAQQAVRGFAPATPLGLWLRNLAMKVLPLLPVEVMLKEALAAANSVTLEGYPPRPGA